MPFKGFSIFSSCGHFFTAERNHFGNFCRGSSKEHFCEIILKSAHWPWRRCRFTVFFSSGGHFVQRSRTILAILVEGHPRIILNSACWPRRRCCLKGFSIFSSNGHFVQRSGTILAILVEGHPRNISVKLF